MRSSAIVRTISIATLLIMLLHSVVMGQSKPRVTVATYSLARYEIIQNSLLPIWQAKYPDIDIVLELHSSTADQVAKVMLTAGTEVAPDIVDTAGTLLFSYVVNGAAVDIAPYVERDLDVDDWFPHSWDEVRYPHETGRGLYALPYDWVGGVLVYNKDLFDQAGMPYPDETWTWEDLRLAARRLTQDTNGDGITDIWGYQLSTLNNVTFDPLVRAYGGELLSVDRRESRLNSPAAAEVLQLYYEMVHQDRSTSYRNAGTALATGRSAMEVMGSWTVRTVDAAGINYGVEMVPQGPVARASYGGSNVWAVIKRQNQDMEAVWTVLQELVALDTLRLISNEYGLPSRLSLIPDWVPTPVNQALVRSAPYMRDGGWTPDWSNWQNAKQVELFAAVGGTVPIPEALERAVNVINLFLDQAY